MNINVEELDLRIPGGRFGASDNHCYVPVFRSGSKSKTQWKMGSIFTKKFYVVYDMTPYDERGEDFIQIGFGL